MITIEQKKEELKKAYPKSKGWHEKVDKMSNAQATAVYIRLSTQGKLGK